MERRLAGRIRQGQMTGGRSSIDGFDLRRTSAQLPPNVIDFKTDEYCQAVRCSRKRKSTESKSPLTDNGRGVQPVGFKRRFWEDLYFTHSGLFVDCGAI
jgi:hypothetical protein